MFFVCLYKRQVFKVEKKKKKTKDKDEKDQSEIVMFKNSDIVLVDDDD